MILLIDSDDLYSQDIVGEILEPKENLFGAFCKTTVAPTTLDRINATILRNTQAFPASTQNIYKFSKSNFKKIRHKKFALRSSGSSSINQKVILLSFANLRANFEALNPHFHINEDSRLLLTLPPYHIGGLMIIIRSLLAGAELIIPPNLHLETLKTFIEEYQPTHLSLVNHQFLALAKDKLFTNYRFPPHILLGGAKPHPEIYDYAKTCNLFYGYGMTETSSNVAIAKISSTESSSKPAKLLSFTPTEANQITIQDQTIIITSPQVAIAELKDTQSTLFNGQIITSDLGEFLPDGTFRVLGRKDRTINRGGIKVSLDEMEEILAKNGYVAKAAAIEDDYGDKAIVFVEVGDKINTGEISATDIKEKILDILGSYLGKYQLPEIRLKERFARNLGKVDLGGIIDC